MMASRFEIEAFPTYIVMDHEGIVQFRHRGWNSQLDTQIDDQIRSLLKKAKAAQEQ